MGVGPIPWDVIDRYALRRGLEEDIVDLFTDVIYAMDNVYLTWMKEEEDRKRQEDENRRKK